MLISRRTCSNVFLIDGITMLLNYYIGLLDIMALIYYITPEARLFVVRKAGYILCSIVIY